MRTREHHYKTYIRKWRLERNNKASASNTLTRSPMEGAKDRYQQCDMVFALQKLRQRTSKDTVFNIRGQERTRRDIEKYWKRKRLTSTRLSPVPATPEGLSYHTPTPVPDEALLGVEDDDVLMDCFRIP